jgi:hypothetical protein
MLLRVCLFMLTATVELRLTLPACLSARRLLFLHVWLRHCAMRQGPV